MTRLTKKILNKLFYFYRLINHTISKRFLKKKYIAHHGLQRNGTNFLLHALRHLDVDVINEFDKKRNKPQHKHFRWYSSKENIPEQIYAEYFNSLIAENVHEVNALCNFPRDTKHIVIYKEENSSIVSVLNWGIRVGWFNSKQDALNSYYLYKLDYRLYYSFWKKLANHNPDYVQLLSFEKLIESNNEIADILKNLDIKFNITDLNLSFKELPQSPRSRKNIIAISDIEKLAKSNK